MNRGAREATRVLEVAFSQGDTNLRAQQRDETSDLPFDAPSTISPSALRICCCCLHFAYREAKRSDMVTLLTGDPVLSEVARTAGVHVNTVSRFLQGRSY